MKIPKKMKIPKWVDELIDKRTKYAENLELEDVSTRLDNWMRKNNIPLDPDYTEGGNMIYHEKLVDLLKQAKSVTKNIMLHSTIDEIIDTSYDDLVVDYLLKNGVVVLPCKCDKCSYRCNDTNKCGIYGRICTENGYCDKALKGSNKNDYSL